MQVVNKTHYQSPQLRAILQRCAEMELEPDKRRRIVVTVCYTGKRNDSCSGEAVIGGRHCTIRIPAGPNGASDPAKAMEEIKVHFAKVTCHEFAHLRGMRHKNMPSFYRWHGNWRPRVEWAATMPLEPKSQPAKPVVDKQQVRYQATLTAISTQEQKLITLAKEYEATQKRIKTELRKLKDRKYYYEHEVFPAQVAV